MAKNSAAVWGIEIGQTALKALRCRMVDGEVVADAFDFIEYPKILSQPEADPDELISQALGQLLERNDSINEKVVISVPGQSGLAKFFKPPPVEVKKVADIVRYEARQQIPFDLDDVVWDFQMMPGSMIEEGYALESEVGLFAMKREMAYRQMAPFVSADIEVDEVQLAPLALYNMIAYDRMHERIETEVFEADNPPASSVLLSIGTDSSDLIVTNGFRIWQRSMPIGGNHFTRQLTKDLKLTFAKAEHLKRNAREAVDPKLIFQTMRPVFNDLVTEVQRSIGFFRSIDKKAEIDELLITGNTVKMPGLAAYLGKNLGFDVHVVDRFNRLKGDDVLSIPTFRDNAPTFAVCYGLCLQGLGASEIHASLVPKEILTERLVRAKKPWALAALSALLIGMTGHYAMTQKSWETTHDNVWKPAKQAVTRVKDDSDAEIKKDEDLTSKLKYLKSVGEEVSGNAERRLKWLEILRVVNELIPRPDVDGGKEMPHEDRKDIHVIEIETKHHDSLTTWFSDELENRYREEMRNWHKLTTGENLPAEQEAALVNDAGPTGEGWVVQLRCYHYYNSPDRLGFEESNHVRRLMTTAFMKGTVDMPVGQNPDGSPILETFTVEEMGISYPLLLNDQKATIERIPNPNYDPETELVMMTELDPDAEPPTLEVRKMDFIFQFVWKENVLSERLKAKEEAREKAEAEAKRVASR